MPSTCAHDSPTIRVFLLRCKLRLPWVEYRELAPSQTEHILPPTTPSWHHRATRDCVSLMPSFPKEFSARSIPPSPVPTRHRSHNPKSISTQSPNQFLFSHFSLLHPLSTPTSQLDPRHRHPTSFFVPLSLLHSLVLFWALPWHLSNNTELIVVQSIRSPRMRLKASLGVLTGIAWLTHAAAVPRM